MKIGIVIRCCRNFGSSRYVVETSRYFVKKHELHIFTNNWDPLDERIVIHKIPTLSSNFYIYEGSFFLFSTIALKFHSFDVTLSQPTRYLSPGVAEMQFVYRAWANYRKENGLNLSLGDRITPIIEKHNIKKAKEIIAISNSVKNEVMHFYNIPEEKVHVIHSGVNLDEFTNKNKKKYSEDIRDKYGINQNDLVLLFVGNPFERKGLRYVFEAMAKLKTKNVKLFILGRDDTEPYMKLAKTLGIEDKIIFAGLLPGVAKYFNIADIFVLPTLYEPFGLVILEAMASGLPVVTSKLAGAAEIIEDGKDGFWIENPKNPSEIAESLNRLIEDDNLRNQMGRKAREKAEKHSWEVVAKQMMNVFELVAKI